MWKRIYMDIKSIVKTHDFRSNMFIGSSLILMISFLHPKLMSIIGTEYDTIDLNEF